MSNLMCPLSTPKLQDLANKLNISNEDAKVWLGSWQTINNKHSEDFPTEKEFKDFIINEYKKSGKSYNTTPKIIYNEDGILKDNAYTRVFDNNDSDNVLNNAPSNTQHAPLLNDKTAQYGVIIDKNLKENYKEWQNKNPNGIVAYRVNFNKYNTPKEAEAGKIGNPFSEGANRGEITVQQFYEWLVTGNNFGNDKATPEYREAIIKKILNTPNNSPILYYTELGRPSHATILGYLINNKDILNDNLSNNQKSKSLTSNDTIDKGTNNTQPALETQKQNFTKELVQQQALSQDALSAIYKNFFTVSPKAQQKVSLVFDPKTRVNRARLIAQLFSNNVTKLYDEQIQELQNRIDNSTDEKEIMALEKSLTEHSRVKAINIVTPAKIFNDVKTLFLDAANMSEEEFTKTEFNRIKQEEQELIDSGELSEEERYSDDEIMSIAKEQAAYKKSEYSKMASDNDVFMALVQEACSFITSAEGCKLSPKIANENYFNTDNLEDIDSNDITSILQSEGLSQEDIAMYKDSWMFKFREISSYSKLSKITRNAIRKIIKTDKDGYEVTDDLGYPIYLEPEQVHATLLEGLMNMLDPEDMIPMIESMEATKPWMSQIVNLLNEDEKAFTAFYVDFRKDFNSYWVQKTKTDPKTGQIITETINVNKPEGIYYLINKWRDNLEAGAIFDKDSIYDKKGDYIRENAAIGRKLSTDLSSLFINRTNDEIIQLLDDDNTFNNIIKLLRMVGINDNVSIIKEALKSDINIMEYKPIFLLLRQLNVIFAGVAKGELVSDNSNKKDLYNKYSSAFNLIAQLFKAYDLQAIEQSINEGGKSYYSHATPNYLGKVIKQLKAANGNMEKFEAMIQKEYRDYEFFYKNGKFLNGWVELLSSDPVMRNILDHKILLNRDKTDYDTWDDLEYTKVLLEEYWSEAPNDSTIKTAWYYVPIQADVKSSEFIKFVRYTGDGYEQQIIEKLCDLVTQEFNRILLVEKRNAAIKEGKPIKPIPNYDINESKGIKGGSEFKFLPFLNTYTVNGVPFIDVLKNKNISSVEYKNIVETAITKMLEAEFEAAYKEWWENGLFEELENGLYKNLKFTGHTKTYKTVINGLNKAKYLLGSSWTASMEALLNSYIKGGPIDSRVAKSIENQIKSIIGNMNNISPTDLDFINRNLVTRNEAKEALREYFYNSTYATSQIYQLLVGDIALYDGIVGLSKRSKEYHSPANKLNTKAKWNGERVGKETERVLYLKDQEIVSSIIDDLTKILNEKVNKGEMSIMDRDFILTQFRNVYVTDAQAYRTFDSYRAVAIMSSKWSDELEDVYNNIKSGKWSASDMYQIFQTIKPFMYTQVSVDSGVKTNENDEYNSHIKMGVQHKNSEFLLFAAEAIVAGSLGKSSKLSTLNQYMIDHNIDVVMFNSAVKVGCQGAIDINNVNTKEEIEEVLNNAIYKNGVEDKQVVHEIPYSDYGDQVSNPEHFIDKIQAIGTQFNRLIGADLEGTVTINGKTMSTKEWLEEYNALYTENLIQAFSQVSKEFKDPKKLEELLQSTIRNNDRYGIDIQNACTLDEKGKFQIPFCDPIITQSIQSLLSSILRDRITKRKFKGGACTQVSCYGLTNELHIIFKDKSGNIVTFEKWKKRKGNENLTQEDYNKFIEQEKKNGTIAIKEFECYLPAFSTQLYEHLIDPVTHQLDVEKLPEKLRKAIGYRIPTEAHHSMVPIYIKGFLPQQNGSAIMLPAEITTISGSDFDIDKLYIILPEYKIDKYDYKSAKKDFERTKGILEQLSKIFDHEGQIIQDISDAPIEFKEWFEENKENYKLINPEFRVIKYNSNKEASENSTAQRNNRLFELMWGVLTAPQTSSKILNPGHFTDIDKTDKVIQILENLSKKDLVQILKDNNLDYVETDSIGNMIRKLYMLNVKKLASIIETYVPQLNPISPRAQVKLQQRNMTGANLIPIYAIHNVNHAIAQQTELAVADDAKFKLYGRTLTNLHAIYNDNKSSILKNNSQWIGASVDNGKNPTLGGLNQNLYTASPTMLLSRLGYSHMEIGLFFKQPIINEIIKAHNLYKYTKSEDTIIEEVIKKYDINSSGADIQNTDKELTFDWMIDNIFYAKDIDNASYKSKANFYARQCLVGNVFKKILKVSNALSELVSNTRQDTVGGAAGSSIAETINRIMKLGEMWRNMNPINNKHYPLVGAKDFMPDLNLDYSNPDTLRKKLLNSKIPFLTAQYYLGVASTEYLFKDYFPHFSKGFQHVAYMLKYSTKNDRISTKTLNKAFDELLVYIMCSKEFLGNQTYTDSNGETQVITAEEKRKEFILEFPNRFQKIIDKNPDIAEIGFIKQIKYKTATSKTPIPILQFKQAGNLTPALKDRYIKDWESMLHSQNPIARNLAIQLFQYGIYRKGFGFGPGTFMHLAPLVLREIVPDYIKTLEELNESSDLYQSFPEMFVRNHLDDKQLVIEVETDTSFFEDKKPMDTVSVTVDVDSGSKDMSLVKNYIKLRGDVIIEFLNYITVKDGDKQAYYKLSKSNLDTAIYYKITPLGINNKFIEYEYSNNIESVIPQNKDGFNVEEYMKELMAKKETEYDEETNNNTLDSGYYESLYTDLVKYNFIDDQQIDDSEKENSNNNKRGEFDNINKNVKLKDADDNDVC